MSVSSRHSSACRLLRVIALTYAAIAELDLDGNPDVTAGDVIRGAFSADEGVLLWRAVATMLAERVRRARLWVESRPLR